MDLAGIVLIVLCVVSVAYGSQMDKESDKESLSKKELILLAKETNERNFYLVLAISLACAAGLAMAVNVMSLKMVHDSGMNLF